MNEPLVTAIVSTWSAERYMRGCLEDLVTQTLGERLEILVIDSNSPENEGDIVREFQRNYANIRYYRTDFREDSNGAFNRAIPLARGKYLTNANTDDRHRPDALALQAKVLDEYPEFGLVYADSLINYRDNETFGNTASRRRYDWPDYTPGAGLSCCLFGPHPLWRREVHQTVGMFDSNHPIASDQDMFLHIAWKFGAVHLRETLGLFLQRPDSNSGANKQRETVADVMQVMKNYRTAIPLHEVFPELTQYPGDFFAPAAALFELGNLCALGPYNDYQLALQFYTQAIDFPFPAGEQREMIGLAFANNTAVVLYCAGMFALAQQTLGAAMALPEAATNQARIGQAQAENRQLMPRDLNFIELRHPVVQSSRTTRGLELTAKGDFRWGSAHQQVPWHVYHGPSGVAVSADDYSRAVAHKPRCPASVLSG